MKSHEHLVRSLLRLAKKERTFLLAGDLESLFRLEARKNALVSKLSNSSVRIDPQKLTELRNVAAENNRLYRAAMLGIQSVKDQMSVLLSRSTEGFKTYAQDGDRTPVHPRTSQLEKRT